MTMARILLVDDDNTIRKMYTDILRSVDFDVKPVESAEEAIELLLEGEKFDLVITDIMLAKMDGWQLLHHIREHMKLDELKLPVIVISAFASAELETKAYRKGANGYLIKPIVPITRLTHMAKIQTGGLRSRFHESE